MGIEEESGLDISIHGGTRLFREGNQSTSRGEIIRCSVVVDCVSYETLVRRVSL